ncbi:hypothetical protein GW17_00033780 [Ensete ventricosum]|nr:hypothetical protein GW17_00033780 [Ensete ventricosum]
MSLAEDHKFDADSDLYLGHPDSPRSKSACVGHSLPCLHGVVWYAQLSRCHAREMPTSGVTLSGSRSPIRRAVAWIRPRRPPRHAGQITLAAFFVSRRRSTRSPRHVGDALMHPHRRPCTRCPSPCSGVGGDGGGLAGGESPQRSKLTSPSLLQYKLKSSLERGWVERLTKG